MITLPMLMNHLKPHILDIYSEKETFCEYRGIYLVDGTPVTENDLIYVGDNDSIAQLLIGNSIESGCVLFSAGDSDLLQNAPRHGTTLITTDLPLIGLYNELFQAFMQYDNWKQLLQAESKRGLRSILQAAANEVGFSVLLLNPNLRLIVQHIRSGEETFMLLEPDNEHNLPFTNLQFLLKKSEIAENNTTILTQRKDGYIYALIPITHEHIILGYLFACSNGRASILNNMMYVLSQTIARQMISDSSILSVSDTFQSLAVQFLDEQAENLDKLEARLRRLPNKPKLFMRGIVIRQIDEDGKPSPIYQQSLRQLCLETQRLFPLDHVALLNECIYVMTSDDKPDSPITVDENPEFEQLLKKHGAFAMVSNPSQRLRGVRVLFRQCFQVLPLAVSVRMEEDEEKRCMRFDRYSPYYIIHLCEKSSLSEMGVHDILYLCHPAVLTLTRYDRAFNSNLRDTLFCFLINDRSISETSRKMFMHRNTTIYKLNKIQDLIHDDLSNPYTRHQLILSCMIIRYAEKYLRSPLNLPPLESSIFRK